MTVEPLLRVRSLQTIIETPTGPVQPVLPVDLDLAPGETLGIVGESGSGKSMLVRSVMGLLPPGARLAPGTQVLFDGQDLAQLGPAELRRYWGTRIGFVPQDPVTSLNPVRKVGAQLMDPLRVHAKMNRRQARERAVDLLRLVGIADPARRLELYPHEMSGGMRQRVLIATAIALNPSLLIADEPTTALDVTVQRQILELIDVLKQEHQMAVILVSHDLALVAEHSDRVAVMYGGKLVEHLPGSSLEHSGRHPYTRGLLLAHPSLTGQVHADLPVIPGEPPDLRSRPPGCPFQPRCPNALPLCATVNPPLDSAGPDHELACHNPHQPDERALAPALGRT